MLKYTKTVLQKVSFNRDLFKKELQKSLRWLRKDEVNVLKTWCVLTFGSIYMDVINEVFSVS